MAKSKPHKRGLDEWVVNNIFAPAFVGILMIGVGLALMCVIISFVFWDTSSFGIVFGNPLYQRMILAIGTVFGIVHFNK